VDVREVDGTSAPDDLLGALATTEAEATADLRGAEPASVERQIGRYRNPGNAVYRHWLAFDDGEPAGVGTFEEHGPTFFYGSVSVKPAYRRRGIGSALYAHLLAAARERNAPSFFGHHATEAGAAFARNVGGVDGSPDLRSVLSLREAELPEAAAPEGIELRTWMVPTPEEMIESYVVGLGAMDDAPVPEGQEYPQLTVERLRESEATLEARGASQFVTVAIEAGDVVSLTGVRVFPRPAPYAFTEDTGTLPRARGRGLAQLVKAENLRYVRRERDDVELVGTFNAKENAAMRAVNEKLGFRPDVWLTPAVVTL
jgi:GNAT superfamily N-acetyltransferase